jgi:hypothetical protein
MPEQPPRFDPYGLFATLDRHRVTYIVVGAFARVVQGTEEITRGVDIVPSTRPENLRRLGQALEDLHARGPALDEERAVYEFATDCGELKVVPEPVGTRGYDDLRRAANREPLGRGVRPSVASTGDLARMLAALGRERELPKLLQLRRVMELERGRVIER